MKDEEILPIAMAVVGVVTYLFYVYRYCIKENLKLKKIFKWLSGISLIMSLCFFLDFALYFWTYKISESKWYSPVVIQRIML